MCVEAVENVRMTLTIDCAIACPFAILRFYGTVHYIDLPALSSLEEHLYDDDNLLRTRYCDIQL